MADNDGLHRKYEVARTDGRDRPGEKHEGCTYFVLDLNHDPHALVALAAYAESCRPNFPSLARDLRRQIDTRRAVEGRTTND